MMDILYILFLPAIIALGLVTSYTDISFGKIRNKHIFLAIVYVPIAYSFLITFNYFTGNVIRFSYLSDLGLNVFIALLVAFFAWNFKVWSAADGKLFFAYACLVPLIAYSNSYLALFPSFIILINTFFPAFIFFSFKIFFLSEMKKKKEFFKDIKLRMILLLFLSVLETSS